MKMKLAGLILGVAVMAAQAQSVRQGIVESLEAMYASARANDDAAANAAATAVVRFGRSGVATLAASTAGRTPAELVWTLRCLREIGAPEGAETAVGLTGHASATVRAEAVWAAYVLDADAAALALVRAASDSDATVRRRAFDGLASSAAASRATGALDAAVRGVLDPDTWVVLRAFEVLAHHPVAAGDGDAVASALARLLPDLDERNAAGVVDVLVRRSGPRATPILQGALGARKATTVAALEGLGRLRAASALPAIQTLARSPEPDVAIAAIRAIAQIRDPSSVEFLVDLLEQTRDPKRIDALAVALRTVTGKLHGTDVGAWRKHLRAISSR